MKPSPNPYIGPRAFASGETLFGRDAELDELTDLLRSERIVLLYGPSGAGKTSLIEAALRPRLAEEEFFVMPTMRVGQEPTDPAELSGDENEYLLSLKMSLDEALNPDRPTDPARLAAMSFRDYLQEAEESLGANRSSPYIVLVFDQFEELFTRGSRDPFDEILTRGHWDEETDEARREFFEEIGDVLRDSGRWAIFSMREDFIAGLDRYLDEVPTELANTYRLELLSGTAAAEAIARPAEAIGVRYDPSALETLVNDLSRVTVRTPDGSDERPGMFVEPVQLQIVCRRLWDALDGDRVLDDDRIEASEVERVAGAVDDALRTYYDETVRAAAARSGIEELALRQWFGEWLITENGLRVQVQRGPAPNDRRAERAALELFQSVFLVRSATRRGTTWFELSHDRMIRPIRASNRTWRQEHAPPLPRFASMWDRERDNQSLLLRGAELREAEVWADENDEILTKTQRQYLAACREVRAADRRKRAAIRWGGAAAALLAAVIVAVTAGQQRRELRELHALHHHRLVLESQAQLVQKNDVLAALLAREAFTEKKRLVSQNLPASKILGDAAVFDVLHRSTELPDFDNIIFDHDGVFRAVAFSPDGTSLAAGGSDGVVWVWELDPARGVRQVGELSQPAMVYSVAFSPDGRWLAAGDLDGNVRLWKRPGFEEHETLTPSRLTITEIAFRPSDDGLLLAVASEDRRVRLFALESDAWRAVSELSGHAAKVRSIAFSMDGRWLASGDDRGSVLIWDLDAGSVETPSMTLSHDAKQNVYALAFLDDGRWIATASPPSAEVSGVTLWKLREATGPRVGEVLPHPGKVRSIAVSADERTLYASTYAGELWRWTGAVGAFSRTADAMTGHAGIVFDVSVSDGRVATVGEDGTLRHWAPVSGPRGALPPHAEAVEHVRLAGDGVDVTTRRETGLPSEALSDVADIAVDQDGRWLAWLGADARVRIRGRYGDDNGHDAREIDVGQTLDVPVAPTTPGRLAMSADQAWLVLGTGLVFHDDDGNPSGRVRLLALDDERAEWESLQFENYRGENGSIDDGDGFSSVAFSADVRWVAAGSYGGTVRVWHISDGSKPKFVLTTNRGEVSAVALGSSGASAAIGYAGGDVLLWETGRLEYPIVLEGLDERVTALAFDEPPGRLVDEPPGRLVAGAESGAVRVFALGPALADRVCELVMRNFSQDEWTRFFPNEPYRCTCPALGAGPGISADACR